MKMVPHTHSFECDCPVHIILTAKKVLEGVYHYR